MLAGLAQVQGTLEEAARISGAGPLQAFLGIVVPIIRPSLAAGWVLAFIPAVAELTLSILLFSVGNETLGVTIFGLNDEGKVTLTAALAFLVTMLLLVDQSRVPGRAARRRRGDPWLSCGSTASARRLPGRAGAATPSGRSATSPSRSAPGSS